MPWLEVRSGTTWTDFGGALCIDDGVISSVQIDPGQSIPASVNVSAIGSHPGYYRAVILVSAYADRIITDEASGQHSQDELANSTSVYLP